jgi:hypothetical protein
MRGLACRDISGLLGGVKFQTCLRSATVVACVSSPLAQAQFYGDPPDATHPWAVHDMNRPQPPRVEPGKTPGAPPSDAIVLFDGTQAAMSNWETVSEKSKGDWVVKDGALQCTPDAGYIQTKEKFGDCQLHIEWAAPTPVHGDSQGRGNSGVFLMGMTEVQVLDNYDNPTYADGFAGSVYGIMPPMANPLRKPGEWQSYDIIFRRPIIKDGKVIDPGAQTVLINGVVVQDNTPLEGGGGHKSRSNPPKPFPETGPLQLQDHGNPVRFRNIWYRNLRKRPADGGTDGQLSPEVTTAKRLEIAGQLVKNAATKSGKDQLLLLLESLTYQPDATVTSLIDEVGSSWLSEINTTPAAKIQSRKGEVMQVDNAVQYLVKHKCMAPGTSLQTGVSAIVKANAWDEKK